MINLLPYQQKAELRAEEEKRLIIILGAGVLVWLICLLLILFSVQIYSQGQLSSQNSILTEAAKKLNTSEVKDFQQKINSANALFLQLDAFYKKPKLTGIIKEISQTIPSGISLTNISFLSGDTTQVSLNGSAETREQLLNFKERLESQSNFKDINFPASNWITPSNINFSATLKLAH